MACQTQPYIASAAGWRARHATTLKFRQNRFYAEGMWLDMAKPTGQPLEGSNVRDREYYLEQRSVRMLVDRYGSARKVSICIR